jgi:rhamnopyranosyl-N-acetylglucosaminyl-diphospho-decaprenol beta-1,3/1,4-galactofuranosyltransferase
VGLGGSVAHLGHGPVSVCAVVVTFNRRDLLEECLTAVSGQARPADRVIVIDNASTDGTAGLVRERFPEADLVTLPENVGSAAGFADGIQRALDGGADWVWTLDDDTIPEPEALARLLDAAEQLAHQRPVALASKVVWTDGGLHPMNYSTPRVQRMDDFVWSVESGYVEIRYTTFISLLVSAGACRRHGLPRKDFFIWSDDIEWTARLLREERGFLVPGSVALHKTATAHTAPAFGDRFYYAIRNGLFILRSPSALTWKEKVLHVIAIAEQVRQYLAANRLRPHALRVLARGVAHGLTGRGGPA